MPFDDHSPNFAYSLVATAPSPATTGVSLVVTAGQGALFPTPPFNATIWPASTQPLTTNAEIVRVTARSTDTLTIVRAQESSSARTVIVGDQIAATVTAKTLTDVEAGFSPDLALTAMTSPRDNVIPASTSAYCCSDYELGGQYGLALLPSSASASNGMVVASPITLATPVVFTSIVVSSINGGFLGTGGNMRAGVYSNSGGAPAALLFQGTAAAFLSTDTSCRILTPAAVELTAGTVWVAVQANAAFSLDSGVSGPGSVFRSTGVTYAGGLPSPFGSADGSDALNTFGIYGCAEYATEIGAGSLLEIG